MKNLDLEKLIIIVSLLLLPVCGWWILSLRKDLEQGRSALQAAIRPNGVIEKIGSLENQLDKMQKAGGDATETYNAPLYFQQQITKSAKGLGSSDYRVDGGRGAKSVTIRNKKVKGKVLDHEYEIKFIGGDKKPKILTRATINAIVVNSEAEGSRVWKLRELKMSNAQLKELRRKREEPPAEVADNWFVDKMVFVRREPVQQNRKPNK